MVTTDMIHDMNKYKPLKTGERPCSINTILLMTGQIKKNKKKKDLHVSNK